METQDHKFISKPDRKGKLILVKEDENTRREKIRILKAFKKTQFISKFDQFENVIGSHK